MNDLRKKELNDLRKKELEAVKKEIRALIKDIENDIHRLEEQANILRTELNDFYGNS